MNYQGQMVNMIRWHMDPKRKFWTWETEKTGGALHSIRPLNRYSKTICAFEVILKIVIRPLTGLLITPHFFKSKCHKMQHYFMY